MRKKLLTFLSMCVCLLVGTANSWADDVTISWTGMALSSGGNNGAEGKASVEDAFTVDAGVVNGLTVNGRKTISSIDYYRYSAPNGEDKSCYFKYSFSVASGKKFTPSKITIEWASSGNASVVFNLYAGSISSAITKVNTSNKEVIETSTIDYTGDATEFYIVPFATSSGKSIILNSVTITGTLENYEQTQWNAPKFEVGDFDATSQQYPITITSEENSVITYKVGDADAVTTTTNSVTVNAAPETVITAKASGTSYDDSSEALYTVPACLAVATPTITIGSYDYEQGGYPVTPACTETDATLTYTFAGGDATACTVGTPFYVADGKLIVTASKTGYTSTSSSEVTINAAPSLESPETSIPFNATADIYDKGKNHVYKSFTINSTYIAGIDSKQGLKLRCNKNSLTKIDGSAVSNVLELTVNEGYTLNTVYLTNVISNGTSTITLNKVYVDGIEKSFSDLGRSDESLEIPESGGNALSEKVFKNVNATKSVIFVFSDLGSETQYRAGVKVEYTAPSSATTYTVNVDNTGFATIGFPEAVKLPEDVTGYAITKVDNEKSTITLLKVEPETVIPASTGLIISTTEGEKTFTATTETATAISDNQLVANTGDVITATSAGQYYVLGDIDTSKKLVGMVKLAANGTIGQYKAYLPVSESGQSKGAYTFVFDGNVTAVNTVEAATVITTDVPAYNLAGQRIDANAKGIKIIKGKKFLVK